MKFRLMEQACGCSTVRGGQALNGACSSLPPALERRVFVVPTRHLKYVLQRSRYQASTTLPQPPRLPCNVATLRGYGFTGE